MDKKTIKIIGIIAAVLSIVSAVLFIIDWKKKKDSEKESNSLGGSGSGGSGSGSKKIDADTPLKIGDSGAVVSELQNYLNAKGQRYNGSLLVVDGDFGNKTKTVAENYFLSRLMPASPITLNRVKSVI